MTGPLLSILSFILPSIAAYLVMDAFLPSSCRRPGIVLLLASLAFGLGLGSAAFLFGAWVIYFGSVGEWYTVFDLSLYSGIVLAFSLYRMKKKASAPSTKRRLVPDRNIYALSLVIIILFTAGFFVLQSLKNPHGVGDGFYNWNLRARFLCFGGVHWNDYFELDWCHPDYPLLLPSINARQWLFNGTGSPLVPVSTALVFLAALLGLVYGSTSVFRTGFHGVLACSLLMAPSCLLITSVNQTADVPVGFYYLSSLALLYLFDRLEQRRYRIVVMAGIMAGMAAWMKNEGIMFLFALPMARTVTAFHGNGLRSNLKELFCFMTAAAPFLALALYFKHIAPANDLIAGQGARETISRLLDLSRHATILHAFILQIAHSDYPMLTGLLLLTAFLFRFSGIGESAFVTVTLLLMGAGFYLIYAVTPWSVDWHVYTSIERILSQLWPSFVFVMLITLDLPAPAMNKKTRIPS